MNRSRFFLVAAAIGLLIGTRSPASAQFVPAGKPIPSPTLLFLGSAAGPTGSGTATRTWQSNLLGNPLGIRRVIVAFANASSGLTVSSCTIGAVPCDEVDNVGSGSSLISFMSALVLGGTTADVTITFSGADTAASSIFLFATDDSLLMSKVPTIGYFASTGSNAAAMTSQFPGGFAMTILNPASSLGGSPILQNGYVYIAGKSSPSLGILGSYNPQNISATWNWTNNIAASVAVAAWR